MTKLSSQDVNQTTKSSSPEPTTKTNPSEKPEEFVSEKSFIDNFTKIFMGDLDAKMKFTFDM